MQTFLNKTAEHLIQQHGVVGLKDLAVVLPSQRSALYLKKELAKIAQKTFIAPHIYTIEEFVLQMTDGKLIDPTELLFLAYDIFKAQEPEMSLDKFVVWGNIMLRDFDLLDMYLVDPNQLYAFLSEVKSIERWGKEYGEEDLDAYLTPNTQKYFQLYDHLNIVYHQVKEKLKQMGLGYRGIFFRKLVEDLQANKSFPIAFGQLYFVGFNALSTSEEALIRICLERYPCQTLWDVDEFYLKNTFHRAGNWLRDYANPLSKKYLSNGEFQWKQNYLKQYPKIIQVVGYENPSGQIYGALQQIDKWAEKYGTEEQVALVLADENLLDQALNYLGAYKDRLNITMGYSLKKSQAFDLLEQFWNLLEHQVEDRFSVLVLEKICQNPLISQYFSHLYFNQKVDFKLFWEKCGGKHDFRIPYRSLEVGFTEFPIFKYIFHPQVPGFVEALNNLKGLFRSLIATISDEHWNEQHDALVLILKEIEKLYLVLKDREAMQLKSGIKLLKQLVLQQKISFEGFEKRTLHVMGLLETRNLDFDRVIILSLNEGILPAAQKRNSLIPLDIASMSLFNLPTFTQADAVTSYHFHRLLHRPKEIMFSHILPGEKAAAKEESRFIKQLRLEWPSYNPNLQWTESVATFEGSKDTLGELPTAIQKTPEILDKIKSKLNGKGLSPSALNSFITCGMRYYLSQIAGLRNETTLDDEMGANVFGTWVHKFLEKLDEEIQKEHQGNYAQAPWQTFIDQIDERLQSALEAIREENGSFDVERGFNVILKEVAKNILNRYLKEMPNWRNESVQVLKLEGEFVYDSSILLSDENKQVKLQGRVDKIDLVNQQEVQIIDYKTGKVSKSDLTVPKASNLYENLTSYDAKEKLVQLWFYKVLFLNELQKDQPTYPFIKAMKGKALLVNPGIVSFRNLKERIQHADLTFEPNESVVDFLRKSDEIIAFWTNELLRADQAFSQTQDLQKCKYCDFASICRRD